MSKILGREVTVVGTFYLKNGLVLDEKVTLTKDNTQEDVDNFINTMNDAIKTCFQKNASFHVTFGQTVFNGRELAAVKIREM